MAADDAERTEKPTPRRIQRARKEGSVAKSAELNAAVILFTGIILLYLFMGKLLEGFIFFFTELWQEIPHFEFTIDNLQKYFALGSGKLALMLAPILLLLMVVGVAVNIAQIGFLFTTKPLQARLNRINPVSGFGRFFSVNGLVELAKNILKVVLVGLVVYWTIKSDFPQFLPLIDKSLGQIVVFIGRLAFKVALRAAILILILAILDLIWVRYKYFKDLRMTKQEIKEEHRQMEGPPEVRSHIRRIQLRTAVQRMMREVPSAEVVITNPTHLAVALKYDSEKMAAPVVIAKGARLIAERIKQIALEHNVPIVENQPLAQSLFKSVDIGQMIPPQFFAAVAEVLAFVYKLKKKYPYAA